MGDAAGDRSPTGVNAEEVLKCVKLEERTSRGALSVGDEEIPNEAANGGKRLEARASVSDGMDGMAEEVADAAAGQKPEEVVEKVDERDDDISDALHSDEGEVRISDDRNEGGLVGHGSASEAGWHCNDRREVNCTGSTATAVAAARVDEAAEAEANTVVIVADEGKCAARGRWCQYCGWSSLGGGSSSSLTATTSPGQKCHSLLSSLPSSSTSAGG